MWIYIYLYLSHIVASRIVLSGCLDGVSQEAEDGTDPQQDGEATKQLATEFNPLRCCGRRGEGIWAIPEQNLCCLGIGQPLYETAERDEQVAKKDKWTLMQSQWNPSLLRVVGFLELDCVEPTEVLFRHLVDSFNNPRTHLDDVSLVFPVYFFYRHLVFCLKEKGPATISTLFIVAIFCMQEKLGGSPNQNCICSMHAGHLRDKNIGAARYGNPGVCFLFWDV